MSTEGPAGGARMPDPASLPRPWIAAYPPGVPPTYRYPDVALTRFLDDAARDFPHRAATWFNGAEIDYVTLRDHVDRFAGALAELGVGHGDRVGIVLPNLPASVIATFATLRLGAVVVQADAMATADELTAQLGDAGCRVAVGLAPRIEVLATVRERVPSLQAIVTTGIEEWLPLARRLLFPIVGRRQGLYRRIRDRDGALRFDDLLEQARPVARPPTVASGDLAVLQYTGGTTGTAKGVRLTHANLVANTFQARLWLPDVQAGKERMLAALPFSHVYGLTLGMLTSVLSAATLVLVLRWDEAEVLRTIDATEPTIFPGVPRMYAALADHPKADRFDLSSIRACVSGAAPLPARIAGRFEQLAGGARLREGYGLSEASPLTHANPIYGRWKPGTIGLPVTDTIACIVDPDDPTRVLSPGEPGELIVHGPQVMAGYWSDGDAEDPVVREGWLLTGDIATVDEDGFFTIVDRKKDVIVLGTGHNVYPTEVEEVLLAHPGVVRATVVGIPEPSGGESVKAYVVTGPGPHVPEAELEAHCRQHLSGFKVPDAFELRDALPETAIGKVLRRELRDEELAGRARHGTGVEV